MSIRAASVLLSCALAGASAQASVVTYDDWAAFSTAAPEVTVHDFSGVDFSGVPYEQAAYGPQTVAGVTFASSGAGPFTSHVAMYGHDHVLSSFSVSPDPADVLITFNALFAFGVTFGGFGVHPEAPVTITLSSGEVFSRPLPPDPGQGTRFFGFVSTTAITGLTLATLADPDPASMFRLQSLDVLSFASVPEPATGGLVALALGLVGAAARRRQR